MEGKSGRREGKNGKRGRNQGTKEKEIRVYMSLRKSEKGSEEEMEEMTRGKRGIKEKTEGKMIRQD